MIWKDYQLLKKKTDFEISKSEFFCGVAETKKMQNNDNSETPYLLKIIIKINDYKGFINV